MPAERGTGSRARRAGQAGFTLLELAVALAVMGALLALVLDRAPQRSVALDLRAGTQRVAAALRLARGRAIAADRVVAFALDGNGFRLDAGAIQALPPGVGARLVPAGVGAIRFAPDGSASGGRVLLAAGGRAASVQVDWLTGGVRVGDGS